MTNTDQKFPTTGTRMTHRMFGTGAICETTTLYQTARMAMFQPDQIDTTCFSAKVLVDLEALQEVV